jgi:hypothetical protein
MMPDVTPLLLLGAIPPRDKVGERSEGHHIGCEQRPRAREVDCLHVARQPMEPLFYVQAVIRAGFRHGALPLLSIFQDQNALAAVMPGG